MKLLPSIINFFLLLFPLLFPPFFRPLFPSTVESNRTNKSTTNNLLISPAEVSAQRHQLVEFG